MRSKFKNLIAHLKYTPRWLSAHAMLTSGVVVVMLIGLFAPSYIATNQQSLPDETTEPAPELQTETHELTSDTSSESSGSDNRNSLSNDWTRDGYRQLSSSNLPGHKVERLGGSNRRTTAIEVSKSYYPNGANQVYISNQNAFADTTQAAAAKDGPILLVAANNTKNQVVRQELRRLKPNKIIILGGTAVVSQKVTRYVKNSYTPANTVRRAGANRFSTAVEASQKFLTDSSRLYLVNSHEYKEQAIAAGLSNKNPVLFTRTYSIPNTTLDEIKRVDPDLVIAVGNNKSVSTQVLRTVRDALPDAKIQRSPGSSQTVVAINAARRYHQGDWNTVVANMDALPDMFVGASVPNAALVLTPQHRLITGITKVLSFKKSTKATIIGGNVVVGGKVFSQLERLTYGGAAVKHLRPGITYFITPHPDDEAAVWPLVDASEYPVFALMTQGETTAFCPKHGMPKGSQACKDARMKSWHDFLDETYSVTYRGDFGDYKLYTGPNSARVVFDLGNGNLTTNEVKSAIQQTRQINYPASNSTDNYVVMAAHDYGHDDHDAVRKGIKQYNYPRRILRYGKTVDAEFSVAWKNYQHFMHCNENNRNGIFQIHYAWLFKGCATNTIFWDVYQNAVNSREGWAKVMSFELL